MSRATIDISVAKTLMTNNFPRLKPISFKIKYDPSLTRLKVAGNIDATRATPATKRRVVKRNERFFIGENLIVQR